VLDVLADLDVAEEAETRLELRPLEAPRDGLDVRVVGATPSRTSPHGVGSRSIMSTSTLEVARQQARGRIEPGRPGADHRDTKRIHARV
jgi:hypothetical protein